MLIINKYIFQNMEPCHFLSDWLLVELFLLLWAFDIVIIVTIKTKICILSQKNNAFL